MLPVKASPLSASAGKKKKKKTAHTDTDISMQRLGEDDASLLKLSRTPAGDGRGFCFPVLKVLRTVRSLDALGSLAYADKLHQFEPQNDLETQNNLIAYHFYRLKSSAALGVDEKDLLVFVKNAKSAFSCCLSH